MPADQSEAFYLLHCLLDELGSVRNLAHQLDVEPGQLRLWLDGIEAVPADLARRALELLSRHR